MDINITGPKIYFTIPIFGGINITQTTVSLLVVTLVILGAAYAMTRRITKRPGGRQVIVEKLVTMLTNTVTDTMGAHNKRFVPYIGTLFLCSIIGSLVGMTQVFRSTTADLSVTLAWALATVFIVWYSNIRQYGFLGWLKSFTEPIVVMTPMNIVSEISTPVAMAFRHFGNVAGGSVLMTIVYAALAGLNTLVFGWLPEAVLAVIPPIFQVGIPAVLSVYFDLFSGFIQAFVFSLLSMVYIGMANPPETEQTVAQRKQAKQLKKSKKKNKTNNLEVK